MGVKKIASIVDNYTAAEEKRRQCILKAQELYSKGYTIREIVEIHSARSYSSSLRIRYKKTVCSTEGPTAFFEAGVPPKKHLRQPSESMDQFNE